MAGTEKSVTMDGRNRLERATPRLVKLRRSEGKFQGGKRRSGKALRKELNKFFDIQRKVLNHFKYKQPVC